MLASVACSYGPNKDWQMASKYLGYAALAWDVGQGIYSYFNDPVQMKIPQTGDFANKGPMQNPNWTYRGILTNANKAQQLANDSGSIVFFTQTRGAISDLVRSGMEEAFGGGLAATQFAGLLSQASEANFAIRLTPYSEGTIISANAIKSLSNNNVQLAAGSNIQWEAPGIFKSTADSLSSAVGATDSYHLNWNDPIGILTSFNPIRIAIYGISGASTMATYHGSPYYPPPSQPLSNYEEYASVCL